MPKTIRKPKYSLHKPTGQARVRIDGKDFYLGPHGSDESRARYEELTERWAEETPPSPPVSLSIDELFLRYMELHYRKGGKPTSEVHLVVMAMRPLIALFGPSLAAAFGPKKLKAVRAKMIEAGWVRNSINLHIGRIRRMFRWATAEEYLSGTIHLRLQALAGLQAGRSEAVESQPVKPVPQAMVDAIEKHVSRQVWGLIRLQLVSGMRPGEATAIRACDINMSGKVWEYRPETHKTEHHDHERVVFLGPKAQAIVKEFLKTDLRGYLFSPIDARAEWVAKKYRDGAKQKREGKRAPRERYSVHTYQKAIERACLKAGIEAWHPHRLRHSAATTIRREFGLDTARTVLGHKSLEVAERYAERDEDAAREAAGKIG